MPPGLLPLGLARWDAPLLALVSHNSDGMTHGFQLAELLDFLAQRSCLVDHY